MKSKNSFFNAILIALTLTIVACGGGGGGGDSDSGTGTGSGGGTGGGGGGPTSPPVSASYVFYLDGNGGLFGYDPVSKITTTLQLNNILAFLQYGGTYNSTTKVVSNNKPVSMITVNDDKFYHVNISNLTQTQLSNVDGSNTLCIIKTMNTYVFYKSAGFDTVCNTSDDSGIFAIHAGMSATDAPLSVPVLPEDVIYDGAGTILKWIAFDFGLLKTYDPSFTNEVTLKTGVYSLTVLGSSDTGAIISTATEVYQYNALNNTLSSVLHTFAGINNSSTQDDTYVYFEDGLNILRVRLDGSAVAELIGTDAVAGTIKVRMKGGNYLAYHHYNSGTGANSLKTIDLSVSNLGNVASLTTVANTHNVFTTSRNGNTLFYNIISATSGYSAGKVNFDGSGKVETADATWAGNGYAETYSVDELYSASYLMMQSVTYDGTTGKVNGGALASYDAGTGAVIQANIGTLTAPLPTGSFYGYGAGLVGSVINTTSFMGDIFYADANVDQSLVNITNSNSTPEFVVY